MLVASMAYRHPVDRFRAVRLARCRGGGPGPAHDQTLVDRPALAGVQAGDFGNERLGLHSGVLTQGVGGRAEMAASSASVTVHPTV
jgi:hypothetical protein